MADGARLAGIELIHFEQYEAIVFGDHFSEPLYSGVLPSLHLPFTAPKDDDGLLLVLVHW
jgi:hypothetical protein